MHFKGIIGAFFVLAIRVYGQCEGGPCSALIPTTTATGSISNGNLGDTPMRLEVRLHGQHWSSNTSVHPILNVGGLSISYLGGNSVPNRLFFGGPDPSSTGYGNCLIIIGSPADITIGINRDVANRLLRVYVLNTQTGAQLGQTCRYSLSGLATGRSIKDQGISLGGPNATGSIAFMRWFTGVVPDGTRIPVAGVTGDLGNWEFERTGRASVGNSQSIDGIGSYDATPILNPACFAGVPQTVNLNSTLRLDGSASYALDGGASLTYKWTYVPGSDGVDQEATLSDSSVASPVASHLLKFGSANFTLTVTDGSSRQSTCTVRNGVVPFDGNGVVDMAKEGRTAAQIAIAGPLIAFGKNPWPWVDDRELAELALQTSNLATAYTQYWKTFAPGSISFTGGSAIVTGTGTSFKALFCGGGTTPVNAPWLVWRYTGTDSITHYTQIRVTACADDTHVTISADYPNTPQAPWPACTPCTGLAYRGVDDTTPATGTWAFNSAPGNYYDNLEAALTGYWRSGLDSFYDFAKLMATNWLEIPTNDYFFNCAALTPQPPGYVCQPGPARGVSATGIILWEQDGHPELLPGLRKIWETADFQLNGYLAGNLPNFDQREFAYWLAFESMCVLIETGAAQTTCRTSVTKALPIFDALRAPYGAWPQFYGESTSAGGAGSVSVTNGSRTVTGVGTRWTSGAVNNAFVTWTGVAGVLPPRDNSTVDGTTYFVTAVDVTAQTLTLDRPYAGTTAAGKGFVMGGVFAGWGTQPFMQGLLGYAFYLAGQATTGETRAAYQKHMDSVVQYLIRATIRAPQGGLYYGAYLPGCVPPFVYSTATQFCWGTDAINTSGYSPSQSRTLATEVIRVFAQDYIQFGSAAVRAHGDLIMSQLFSKPGTGGPNPDGKYLSDYDDGSTFFSGTSPLGKAPKWYGLLCGFAGGCSTWPAARVARAPESAANFSQSLVLIAGVVYRFAVPAQAPFSNLGNARLEMRIHNWRIPLARTSIYDHAGFQIYLRNTGELCAFNPLDSFGEAGGEMCANIAGHEDVTIRVQRDVAAQRFRYEVWSTAGDWSAVTYCGSEERGTQGNRFACPISVVSLATWAGSGKFGDLLTEAQIAWVKWYSSLSSGGPAVEYQAADLADWTFEGTLTDSASYKLDLTGAPSSFTTTSVYPPACAAGASQVLRAGMPAKLDGTGSFALDGGSLLSYQWRQVSGPSPVIWASAVVAEPSLEGLVFGTYVFQLTVRDSSGRSTSCTVKDGAVATDDNGVVVVADPKIDALIGPLVRVGANRWPWNDDRNAAAAKAQIKNLTDYYKPWWRSFQPGTVSVTANSDVVTGTDTHLTDLCNGGSMPRPSARIILQYAGTDGVTHYLDRGITGCTDDTHVTMAAPYPAGPWNTLPSCAGGCSGWSYAFGWEGDAGWSLWSYGPAPANYYDNVVAFYALYYRTGIDDYLDAARQLADLWWEYPGFDQGTACNTFQSNYTATCWPARQMSLMGLVIRALDGREDMWSGLRIVRERSQDYLNRVLPSNGRLNDLREDAYHLAMIAECAIAEPDASQQRQCRDTLASSANAVWGAFQRPGGGWEQFSSSLSSIPALGGAGSVSVTSGQTLVRSSGTNWTSTSFGDGAFWVFDAPATALPADNSRGDATSYQVRQVDPATQTLLLDRPYEGASGEGKGYAFGNLGFVGWGAQPSMQGLLGTAFGLAAGAMDGADNTVRDQYRGYNAAAINWIVTQGLNRDLKGLYSGSRFIGCVPPIPSNNRFCYPSGVTPSQARTLSAEVLRAFGSSYVQTRDSIVRDNADWLMSAMFSKPGTGGPDADGSYVTDLDDSGSYLAGTPPLGTSPQWFGKFFGFPNVTSWPAYRLGGVLPPSPKPVPVDFDLSRVDGAQQARVTLRDPTGLVTTVVCASSPCTVTADARQGNALAAIEYLSGTGNVLAAGRPFVLAVR